MQRRRVLVTGAGALLGQGIIRSLRESSLSVEIIAADPSPLAAGLYWADHRRLVPLANDDGYIEALSRLLHEDRPDAVFIGTDVELLSLARERSQLEHRFSTHIVVSDPEVIAIADDKYDTFLFLKRNGLPAPDSCLQGEESELLRRVGFPLIVKPRVGARSVGVHRVENSAALQYALSTVASPVIQECVSSDAEEYTAGVLYFDGECRASIVMRRDLRDGNTYRAYVDAYPELNAFVRDAAERLRPYGPANFQFRLHEGTPKIFEINARFSGTTPLRMRAGFNEVEMTLKHLLEGQPVSQPPVEPMTILRHWSETVVRPEEVARVT